MPKPVGQARRTTRGGSAMKPLLLTLALAVTCLLAAGCGEDGATVPADAGLLVPTPTPIIMAHVGDPIWRVSPSLEEQTFTSNVIVVASLASVTAETETLPSGSGVAPTYRPLQVLRFTAHEYLKGTGPNEAVVVVRGDHTYVTKAEAQAAAEAAVSGRNTTWDKRRAVIFFQTLRPAYVPAGAASGETFAFNLSNPAVQSEWDYTVDTLSRAWLPARDAVLGQAGSAESQEFITDGATSPPPVISLSGLRAKIAEVEALLKAGEGIAGYTTCIFGKILHERSRRAVPWIGPFREASAIASGSAAGTEVHRERYSHSDPAYHRYWLSGSDKDLFQAFIADDDASPGNGYDHALATSRPLPDGTYRVHYNWQHYRHIPCNSIPTDTYRDWTVTVTAPAGTTHEAFFDPVAIGAGFGADGTNGALKPKAFTVGGSSASLSSLTWQGGSVVLTLSPYAALTGQTLDVLAVDGALTLSLAASAATIDSTAGTLTWSVASQPWQAGDLLMLRLRSGAASPTATPTATPSVTATPTFGPTPTPS